jgi:hypothetical protein
VSPAEPRFDTVAELCPFAPDIIDDAELIAQSLVLEELGTDWVAYLRKPAHDGFLAANRTGFSPFHNRLNES